MLPWLLALAGVLLALVVAYWLLVLTEGAYLGPRVVTSLYDRVARRYDTIKQFDEADEAYFLGRPVARFLDGRYSDGSKPWLLDVASGTGRLPLAVLKASDGRCHIVALDRAQAMLRQAQAKLSAQGWDDVVCLAHDAAQLPFADGQFCVAACLEALEFMPDPAQVMSELLRVLQPGGLLLLTNRIGRDARLMPGKIFSRNRLSELLRAKGAVGVEIMPWQVDYDLVFALKAGASDPAAVRNWVDLVRCPRCGLTVVSGQAGGQPVLACPVDHWRLELHAGLWQVTN